MSVKNKFKKTALIQAIALVSFASAVSAGGPNPSISHTQTLGTDVTPGVCGVDSVLSVDYGSQVSFCYTVTNDGDEPFDLHTLDTSEFGQLLDQESLVLAPGESVSVTDVRTLQSSFINDSTWFAEQSPPPPYSVTLLSGGDYVYTDISGTGDELIFADIDDGEENLTVPFIFNYFGTDLTDLRIGANGAVLMGETTGEVAFGNVGLPTAGSPILAPFWEDLRFVGGGLFTQTDGTAPNQTFTIQWNGINRWNNPQEPDTNSATFQVVLFEGTNEIQFRYEDVIFGGGTASADGGAGATIGIDSGDGSIAVQYSLNGSTLLTDMTSLSFVPQGPGGVLENAEDSSLAAVSVLIPQVDVDPGTIDAEVEIGEMVDEILTITNSGQSTLDWSIEQASAPAIRTLPLSDYQPELTGSNPVIDRPFNSDGKSLSSAYKNSLDSILGADAFAYGVDIFNEVFGSSDPTDPMTGVNAISANTTFISSGAFLGEDFETLYVVELIGDAEDRLYSINVINGLQTFIGLMDVDTDPATENFAGMSYDPVTDQMYAATNGSISNLYTLDVSNGQTTLVGEITNTTALIDIAFSPAGVLFAHDIGTDSILQIDSVTGAGTVIGATGFDANFIQGMDFDDSTGILYLATINDVLQDDEIRSVDLQTGATTLIGSYPDIVEFGAFAFAVPLPCVLPSDISWLSFSSDTGALSAGMSDDVNVTLDSTGLDVGTYEAQVCVFSNDPDEPLISVPVTLQVNDLIFANGFEDPAP